MIEFTASDIVAIWFTVFFTACIIFGAVVKAKELRNLDND